MTELYHLQMAVRLDVAGARLLVYDTQCTTEAPISSKHHDQII